MAKIDVLVLDDWGMGPIDAALRADLLEMIDERLKPSFWEIAGPLRSACSNAWIDIRSAGVKCE